MAKEKISERNKAKVNGLFKDDGLDDGDIYRIENESVCPVQFISEFNDVFKAVNYLEKNILPNSGGWTDQPAKLMVFANVAQIERMKAT